MKEEIIFNEKEYPLKHGYKEKARLGIVFFILCICMLGAIFFVGGICIIFSSIILVYSIVGLLSNIGRHTYLLVYRDKIVLPTRPLKLFFLRKVDYLSFSEMDEVLFTTELPSSLPMFTLSPIMLIKMKNGNRKWIYNIFSPMIKKEEAVPIMNKYATEHDGSFFDFRNAVFSCCSDHGIEVTPLTSNDIPWWRGGTQQNR